MFTVERTVKTIKDLDALAQQSEIKYTVMDDTPYKDYFKNMARAEKALYQKWKDLTLTSTAESSLYRVWDYPITEKYTKLYQTMVTTGMVTSASEGLQKVLNAEDGTFAFIHDAKLVHYEVLNLSLIHI